jgi:hypothetical protein
MAVKQVSAAAEAVSLGEENVAFYVKPGKDEISAPAAQDRNSPNAAARPIFLPELILPGRWAVPAL